MSNAHTLAQVISFFAPQPLVLGAELVALGAGVSKVESYIARIYGVRSFCRRWCRVQH
jgi:hypothetical protein